MPLTPRARPGGDRSLLQRRARFRSRRAETASTTAHSTWRSWFQATRRNSFYDDAVIELPGLFRDSQGSNLRLYEPGREVTPSRLRRFPRARRLCHPSRKHPQPAPNNQHSPDLKGLRIRVPTIDTEAADAQRAWRHPSCSCRSTRRWRRLSSGVVDGALSPPAMLFEFGIGRGHQHPLHAPNQRRVDVVGDGPQGVRKIARTGSTDHPQIQRHLDRKPLC